MKQIVKMWFKENWCDLVYNLLLFVIFLIIFCGVKVSLYLCSFMIVSLCIIYNVWDIRKTCNKNRKRGE